MPLRALFVVAAACGLAAATAVAADPCTNDGGLVPHSVLVLSGMDDLRFYVDLREVAGGTELVSVWLYQETNGDLSGPRMGLQRGSLCGWMPSFLCRGDPCMDPLEPGTFPDTKWH